MCLVATAFLRRGHEELSASDVILYSSLLSRALSSRGSRLCALGVASSVQRARWSTLVLSATHILLGYRSGSSGMKARKVRLDSQLFDVLLRFKD